MSLKRKIGVAAAVSFGILGAAHNGDKGRPTETKAVPANAIEDLGRISLPDPGFTITFEAGETPDSEAMAIAGIEPGKLDSATAAQRQIYVHTREAIAGALEDEGISPNAIPEDHTLRLGHDPNGE